MVVVQRTHKLKHDRDWLPAGVRRKSRIVAGAIWGAAGVALVGTVAIAPMSLLVWKVFAGGGLGIAVAGQRAGHAVFRRQLTKMARGEVQLAEVGTHDEGTMVVVSGTIEATAPLTGVLRDSAGVYRRMVIKSGGTRWVHEAAVDFALIGDGGHRLLIQAGGARWLAAQPEEMEYPAMRLDRDGVDGAVRQLVRANGEPTIEASERILAIGTRVQIVGYKTASADATGEAQGYRLPPLRATLRSGPDLPLVITTAEDLES